MDIDDVSMYFSKGLNNQGETFKELVIGYKTIFINTYNTVVQDMSFSREENSILFRHEAFQLWESECMGLLLEISKEYLHISKRGINILAVGTMEKKKIQDAEGNDKMIHSFDSLSYLKLNPNNFILLKC